jgi:hypothetical protein
MLGERENGTDKLGQALQAYSEALKERTRADDSLKWAVTVGDQGIGDDSPCRPH